MSQQNDNYAIISHPYAFAIVHCKKEIHKITEKVLAARHTQHYPFIYGHFF